MKALTQYIVVGALALLAAVTVVQGELALAEHSGGDAATVAAPGAQGPDRHR